jgi:hypothetical protein
LKGLRNQPFFILVLTKNLFKFSTNQQKRQFRLQQKKRQYVQHHEWHFQFTYTPRATRCMQLGRLLTQGTRIGLNARDPNLGGKNL